MSAPSPSPWMREPLAHFAAGAALLFAAYAWLNPSAPPADPGRQVRIGQAEVNWLSATWERQWGRAPTQEELRTLVANLLKEELLSREAREMRLDENDTIVRRRLAQKLEFLLQDTARVREPGDDELRRFYDASPGGFLAEARISFSQIYFHRERRGDALALLPKLVDVSPTAAARLGDRLMVEAEFRLADRQAVAAAFGPEFARGVFELEPGAWHGPLESGYGLHLVRVAAAQPARRRDFVEVRAIVLERWREREQREAEARFFERLAAKYEVLIDESVTAAIGEPVTIAGGR